MRKILLLAFVSLLGLAGGSQVSAAGFQGPCSVATLRGNYGYSFTGTVTTWGSLVGQGTLVFNGSGELTGAYAENVAGLVFSGKFTGVFTVASDCTGSAIITGALNTWKTELRFVIVNNGEEVLLVDSDKDKVVSGTAKKM